MHAESSRAGRVIPAGIWAWSPRVAQGLTIEGRPESEAAEESQIKARGISEAAEVALDGMSAAVLDGMRSRRRKRTPEAWER